jgi:hypothetical protein
MLSVLNALFLVGVLISDITLYSDAMFVGPKGERARNQVVAVSMHREYWREDGKGTCSFTGVLVPFTHDWTEIDDTATPPRVIREADPESVVGQALLINKKACAGKEPELMLRAGQKFLKGNFLVKGMEIVVSDVASMNEGVRYKWLGQVFGRLEKLAAEGDATAKDFLASMETLAAQKKASISAGTSTPDTAENSEAAAPAH